MIECRTCNIGIDREDAFREYGYRVHIRCPKCDALLPTGFNEDDLPKAKFVGSYVVDLEPTYEGVEIDENTPLWALDSFAQLTNHKDEGEDDAA